MTPEMEILLIQSVAKIESRTEEMHVRLFGNGQPGIVEKYDKRLDSIEEDHQKFVGIVKFLKYAAAIGPILIATVEFVIHTWLPFRQQ